MPISLARWKKDWTLMSIFFNGNEIAAITKKLKQLIPETIVFCSFENRFARSGGLSAVTTNILPYLKEVNPVQAVVLMTPYYPKIISSRRVRSTSISFTVPHNHKTVTAELYEFTWKYDLPRSGTLKEYYIKAEGFFETRCKVHDPYLYESDNQQKNAAMLSENALFFCKAVPLALNALNIRSNIVFHLHEWQTSLIALTAKEAMLRGTLESCGTVQTMHNSYDAPIPRSLLAEAVKETRRKKIVRLADPALSAYQIGLQLVDAPLTTVSEHFAEELTSDIIQTGHFAPHLQTILRAGGIIGINNGMFSDLSPEFPRGADHSLDEVHSIKIKNRKKLLQILTSYRPPERFGDLTYGGRTISRLPESVPIFLMSGRLDPVQKGYYVFLRALESFSEDEIKVILTPMTVNSDDLDYFYEVACKCRGNVTVIPVRMKQGYHELQTGATFGVMPSIYEPFGAAVEYIACGTINIARATGGLLNQIDSRCGFLYRERTALYTIENIRNFVYTKNLIQARKINPWAQDMADTLSLVLRKAADLYKNHPDDYYQMILNGFEKAGQFTWENSARAYFQVYKMVSNV